MTSVAGSGILAVRQRDAGFPAQKVYAASRLWHKAHDKVEKR
jgi:hypothetical protein